MVLWGVRSFLDSRFNSKVMEWFAQIGFVLLSSLLLFPYTLRGIYMFSRV